MTADCAARTALRGAVVTFAAAFLYSSPAQTDSNSVWSELPKFEMKGGLKAFWNVSSRDDRAHAKTAEAHGFSRVTILNTFADYPGKQKDSIVEFLGHRNSNPWIKPDFFEQVVRRNIESAGGEGIVVHDIEFQYQQNLAIPWYVGSARAMSGAKSFEEFSDAYWREWATWLSLPAVWTKERFPRTPVGIYGFWPYFPDNVRRINSSDATTSYYHDHDLSIWRHIEPHVDFVLVSSYMDSSDPVALYHSASEIEANHHREKALLDKPIYVYLWLRQYEHDWEKAANFLAPHIVEAMAILPYFSGAKGTVLWGYEPQVKTGDPLPYRELGTYVHAIARVAELSEFIGTGRLVIADSARLLWSQRKPIVRRIEMTDGRCVFMAMNPWQSDSTVSTISVTCSGRNVVLPVNGRHTTLALVRSDRVELH